MPEIRSHDLQGRPYAKLSELKAGDIVWVDGDFTCISPWSSAIIKINKDGILSIPCAEGAHTLDGQLEDGDFLIGIYRSNPRA